MTKCSEYENISLEDKFDEILDYLENPTMLVYMNNEVFDQGSYGKYSIE